MYGSDSPNLPYAWDRQLRITEPVGLSPQALEAFLGGNARTLFMVDDVGT